MKDKQLLEEFFKRYASGSGTAQEHEAFLQWLATLSTADQTRVSRLYYGVFKQQQASATTAHPNLLNRIESSLDQLELQESRPEPTRFRMSKLQIWSIAATLLLITSAAFYFLSNPNPSGIEQLESIAIDIQKDKAVVDGHAIFRLANGEEIDLDELQVNKGILKSNLEIIKTSANEVVFRSIGPPADPAAAIENNLVVTPKGRQYQITLPDGSKIWLNSASAFNFPSSFTATERNLALSGEGYFEIAKDPAKPFIVETASQRVEVLGTHFNLSAYADEHSTNTTLLEGRVRVVPKASEKSVLLTPGQLARVGKAVQVLPADTSAAVSWKNGYFSFSGEKIQTIMRKLSRWYDVDVQYSGKPTKEDFIGRVPQTAELVEILRMLELTGAVHFKVDASKSQANGKERRVIVMP